LETLGNPFKKAGLVLLIVGILDIGVMFYCIMNQINYGSSFNIFAVIAGILLIRGGAKTARVVRWFSAFFILIFIGFFLLSPLFIPIDLQIAQFKINPIEVLSSYASTIFLIGVLIWVYMQLSMPDALAKLKEAGYKIQRPQSALYTALVFLVLGGVSLGYILNSGSAKKAELLAQEQFGSNYKYRVANLNFANDHGVAIVTAYNNNEIKNVQVQW